MCCNFQRDQQAIVSLITSRILRRWLLSTVGARSETSSPHKLQRAENIQGYALPIVFGEVCAVVVCSCILYRIFQCLAYRQRERERGRPSLSPSATRRNRKRISCPASSLAGFNCCEIRPFYSFPLWRARYPHFQFNVVLFRSACFNHATNHPYFTTYNFVASMTSREEPDGINFEILEKVVVFN